MAGAPLNRTSVSSRDALEETFFLGLRLTRGVDLKAVSAHFRVDVEGMFGEMIRESQSSGLLELEGNTVRLTAAGRLLSNEVFQRFISTPAT